MADLRLRLEDKLRAEANNRTASQTNLYVKSFQSAELADAERWIQMSQFSPKRFENSTHPRRTTERRILPFDI